MTPDRGRTDMSRQRSPVPAAGGRTSTETITWLASWRILLISSSSRGELLLPSDGDRRSCLQTASLPSRPFP